MDLGDVSLLDLDKVERLARERAYGVGSNAVLALIARVRAAEAERDRLRAELDEAVAVAKDIGEVLLQIDPFAEQQEKAHRAESGER